MIRKYVDEAGRLPRGYGVAWMDWDGHMYRPRAVCYPLGLNIVARWLFILYLRSRLYGAPGGAAAWDSMGRFQPEALNAAIEVAGKRREVVLSIGDAGRMAIAVDRLRAKERMLGRLVKYGKMLNQGPVLEFQGHRMTIAAGAAAAREFMEGLAGIKAEVQHYDQLFPEAPEAEQAADMEARHGC